jgi:hypothetical protein
MNNSKNTLALGFSFLLFLSLCVFFKSLALWFSLGLNLDDLWFRLSLVCVALFMFRYIEDKPSKIKVSLLFAVLLFLSFWINAYLLDVSFDGNWYQKEAIIQMAKGWNPYHSPPIDPARVPSAGQWINYYGKATWLFGSLVYDTFKKIELGKAYNLILILAVYFMSVSCLQTHLKTRKNLSWIIALVCALSPVVNYQIFTYFVDGQMASLVSCVFLFMFLAFTTNSKLAYIGLICSSVLMIDTKATGLVYGVVTLGAATFLSFLYKREIFGNILKTSFVIGIVSLVVGFNPYITSLQRYGSPIYPFSSGYSFSGMTPPGALIYEHLPEKYKPMNRFEKLGHSLFSASGFAEEPHLKIPFVIEKGEAGRFWNNDFRYGGFGPLFSGILILSLCVFIFLLRTLRFKEAAILIYFPVGVILLTTLLNPEACWARYAPQLYLLGPYALILALVFFPKKPIFAGILGVLLLVNSESILENNLRYEIGLSSGLDKILYNLRGKPIVVDFGIFRPLRVRLDEYGIKYTEVTGTKERGVPGGTRVGYEMTIFDKIP